MTEIQIKLSDLLNQNPKLAQFFVFERLLQVIRLIQNENYGTNNPQL